MGAILRPPGPTPRWLFYSSGRVGGAPADSWAASPPAARQADPEPRDPHLQANQVAPIQRAGGRRAPRSTGRPPTALQPLDRLRCRAIVAVAGTWRPFRSCRRGRIAPPSAGASPTCARRPAGASLGRRWPGAMRRGMLVTGAVGSAPPTPSHARLLHLPPPKIPLRRRLCAKTQAAPFPQATFERERGAAGDRQMPARVPTAPLFAGRVGPPRFPFNSSPAG